MMKRGFSKWKFSNSGSEALGKNSYNNNLNPTETETATRELRIFPIHKSFILSMRRVEA